MIRHPRQFITLLLAALIVYAATTALAEVQKSLHPCGGLQLCAS